MIVVVMEVVAWRFILLIISLIAIIPGIASIPWIKVAISRRGAADSWRQLTHGPQGMINALLQT